MENLQFVIPTEKGNSADSATFCDKMGGNIVIITSGKQNELVNEFLKEVKRMKSFWIGYNDFNQEGNFTWSDGAQRKFENWAQGEPNNHSFIDCGQYHFHRNANNGTWKDANCFLRRPFLCQIPKGEAVVLFGHPVYEGFYFHFI